MDKFNLSKMGITVEFLPVVDREFNIIANEAVMKLEDDNPNQENFSFHAQEFYEVQAAIDLYHKKLAIEIYKGTVPLLLTPSFGVCYSPHKSFPQLSGVMVVDRDILSSPEGVRSVLGDYGHSALSLPFLTKLRPEYIKTMWNTIHSSDDETYNEDGLVKLVQEYKDMGFQFMVDSIDTQAEFEYWKRLADAFAGSWISASVSK